MWNTEVNLFQTVPKELRLYMQLLLTTDCKAKLSALRTISRMQVQMFYHYSMRRACGNVQRLRMRELNWSCPFYVKLASTHLILSAYLIIRSFSLIIPSLCSSDVEWRLQTLCQVGIGENNSGKSYKQKNITKGNIICQKAKTPRIIYSILMVFS